MTDEEIVKKIQQGDTDKYAEIVERYQNKLFGYIKHLVNQNEEEVEDLLQDVFVSAYKNLLSFDTRKQFSSWIFRVAHNKSIDYFKKKKIDTVFRNSVEDEEDWVENLPSKIKSDEEIEIEKEKNEEIRMAIEKLELKYREVVILYYFEDKSYEEISDILHIPTSNVGVMLHRAKKALKILLNKNYEKN